MEADCIVAEVNQGGDMVKAVIAQVDASVPVRAVRANRGKWVRAEPVAALYAQGRVMHRPGLTALEDEMCAFGADGTSGGRSPDRVDALVWALTELMLGTGGAAGAVVGDPLPRASRGRGTMRRRWRGRVERGVCGRPLHRLRRSPSPFARERTLTPTPRVRSKEQTDAELVEPADRGASTLRRSGRLFRCSSLVSWNELDPSWTRRGFVSLVQRGVCRRTRWSIAACG